MPSPRPAKARAGTRTRGRAATPARSCQALLADEETRCSSHARGRGRYCLTHGQEYGQLTGAYKAASKNVEALEPEIQHAKVCVDVLESPAAVDAVIARVDQFLEALKDEIGGRETHHKRFFQVVDENHRYRLERQREQEAGAVRLLEGLGRRREVLVAVEEKKRDDDRLRAIEETHRTTVAEGWAYRQAIEDAQRRATEEVPRKAIEDAQPMDIAETERKAGQRARSVLGERTNIATSNQADAGPKSVETVEVAGWAPKPPPKDWPSVVYPPSLYQASQYPPTGAYDSALQRSREAQSPLLPAKTTRAPVPMGPSSSWPVDIERQGPPAARFGSGWQACTEEGTERRTPREATLIDRMRTALFWVATFFVFCYLAVVDSLHGCYRLVVPVG